MQAAGFDRGDRPVSIVPAVRSLSFRLTTVPLSQRLDETERPIDPDLGLDRLRRCPRLLTRIVYPTGGGKRCLHRNCMIMTRETLVDKPPRRSCQSSLRPCPGIDLHGSFPDPAIRCTFR